MRYWLDTEFVDDGKTIDLISIGLVCEDGRELYLQSVEFDESKANEWVKTNVLPHLALCPCCGHKVNHEDVGKCRDKRCQWRTRAQIRDDIKYFFNPSDGIELWGWCSGYDFVAFCQLFGTMMDVPKGYPHYIKDLQHVLDEYGISDNNLPQQVGIAHNALEDAKHIKKLWEYTVWN